MYYHLPNGCVLALDMENTLVGYCLIPIFLMLFH